MNDEIISAPEATPVVSDAPASVSEDQAMADIFDKLTAKDAAPSRDEGGRFKPKEPAGAVPAVAADPDQPEAEASGNESSFSERQVQPVALPPNWPKDKADAFNAIPETARGPVQEVLQGLHAKMSDQGRALSVYREFDPILADMKAKYPDHFTGPDAKTPAQVFNYLYDWQKAIDQNPVAALLKIAENQGVIPQLVQHFTQAGQQGGQPAPSPQFDPAAVLKQVEQRFMAQISPEKIEQKVSAVLEKTRTSEAVERFAAEKPHWNDVEAQLGDFIEIVRRRNPDASPMAVLEEAYDMAVHANPATRAKVTAAAPAAAAKVADEKRAAAAKAANQLNVKTTSSGKTRQRSEDERLSEIWDRTTSAA